jgi:hypothetical protein
VSRGDDEHGHQQSAAAEAGQDLEPAAPGQPQIQQHGVERLGGGEKVAVLAGAGDGDVVALTAQAGAQRASDLGIVLDDKHAHEAQETRAGPHRRPCAGSSPRGGEHPGVSDPGMSIP